MTADGITERRNTVTQLEQLCGGLVFKGAVPDGEDIPRLPDGKIAPHIVVDFGAPIKTTRERSLGVGEKGQPHILPVNVACIAGDADTAENILKDAFDLLVDWAPSETADPYDAQGGYGSRRPSTGNTPTRFIEGLFLETSVNVGFGLDTAP